MARQYQRYIKEDLAILVSNNVSYAAVLRHLGKQPRGGSVTNMKLMCKRWGIDTSHMTGQGHNRGKRSNKRKTPDEVLVMGSSMDHRVAAIKLRLALLEIGIEHICHVCGISEWMGRDLVLEIDHIDEQYWNNQRENLQFLCPNCHSMKNK